MVTIDDFKKLEIRIGTVVSAEKVSDTDKLLKLSVDFGEEAPRQIVSGIAEYVAPEEIIGLQFPFVANLESRSIRGIESQGMILALGSDKNSFSLISPRRQVTPGSLIR
ncbi:MAG: methionyl-tRNA synthetase [Parcubacteria group bacterium Gr01-1014_48]|nr:MAG: methionyl-tRNA synthetase [Parcubacteria group bacterium Greene0416_14]TSC73859.1 MAG: methionyl-tRNA synthetase [Parcubacteria group bacterium Gr01-1014_48]TSD00412.1 MAG: methionyl-tRNA synthetase [Parcubacteria group bacterium Greene1014_15]TSD07523.1 MAG: methionyl-tRNA synthetase [Parcubacteria group bacterium Greene0714_4]